MFGSLGLVVVGALLLCILLLDLTTLGKHLAMMRQNVCPAADDENALVAEKLEKWKKKVHKKPKTIIARKKKSVQSFHEENEKPSKGSAKSTRSK